MIARIEAIARRPKGACEATVRTGKLVCSPCARARH